MSLISVAYLLPAMRNRRAISQSLMPHKTLIRSNKTVGSFVRQTLRRPLFTCFATFPEECKATTLDLDLITIRMAELRAAIPTE